MQLIRVAIKAFIACEEATQEHGSALLFHYDLAQSFSYVIP
jgi:hypothetical protein